MSILTVFPEALTRRQVYYRMFYTLEVGDGHPGRQAG